MTDMKVGVQTQETSAPLSNEFSASLKNMVLEDYKTTFNNAADKAIMELGLPKEQSARLYDALSNPKLGSKLSPDEQSLLNEIAPKITDQVNKEISAKYNLPSGWSPLATDTASWTPTETIAKTKSAKGVGEVEYTGKSTMNGVGDSGQPILPAPPAKFPSLPKPQLDQPVPYAKYDKMVIQTTYDETFKKIGFEHTEALKLSPDQTQKLYNALIHPGMRSFLTAEEQAIVKDIEAKITPAVTRLVAAQFNLPGAWTPDSKDPVSWTPLVPAHIDPALREALFAKVMGETAEKSLDSTLKAAEAVLYRLPPSHPDRILLKDFIKMIASALQEVRDMMRNLQVADAKMQKELSTAKFDAIKEKIRMGEAAAKKMEEAAAKMKSMGDLTLAMKIIGPILSAVGTALGCGVGAIVFALGFVPGLQGLLVIGAVMIATSVIIGAITLAISIADSATGFMGKILEEIGKSMDESIKRDCIARGVTDPAEIKKCQLAAKICTAIIVIVAVIIVAVALVALMALIPGVGTGAAAGVATASIQAVVNVVASFCVELAKSLVTEGAKAILMAIFMAAMQMLTQAILDAAANDPNITKEGKEALKWILMVGTLMASLLLGAVMGASAKGSKTGGAEKTATQAADTVQRTISEKIKQAVKQLIDSSIKSAQAAMDEFKSSVKNIPKTVQAGIVNGINDAVENLTKFLTSPGQTIKESATKEAQLFLKGIKDMFWVTTEGKSQQRVAGEVTVKIFQTAADIAKAAPGAAGCAQGIAQGVIMLRVANILREKGQIEESMEILQAIAELLSSMLKKLEGGMEGRQEDIANISEMIKGYFSKIGQSVGASFQALNSRG